jgi:hypothetical protein
MRRILLAAVVMVGAATGCSSNPLLGTWKLADGGAGCGTNVVFQSDQAVWDGVVNPATYVVRGNVVTIPSHLQAMGGYDVNYNMVDHDHMFWEVVGGGRCTYVRVS